MAAECSAARSTLAAVNLVVSRDAVPRIAQYYTTLLGMVEDKEKVVEDASFAARGLQRLSFSFAGSAQSCGLNFYSGARVQTMQIPRGDVYWKIALHLEDVDASGEAYKAAGGAWGGGSQFLDVGYLGHTQDPAGFTIEFLQTTFESNAEVRKQRKEAAGLGGPLVQKQDPVVGLLTMRSSRIEESLIFYTKILGMKLICIEPVTPYGFELYFLAFTDEEPPNPQDLKAVENREWLYQRPYTILEIQVFARATPLGGTDLPAGAGGFDSLSIVVDEDTYSALSSNFKEEEGLLRDPDGVKIWVTRRLA